MKHRKLVDWPMIIVIIITLLLGVIFSIVETTTEYNKLYNKVAKQQQQIEEMTEATEILIDTLVRCNRERHICREFLFDISSNSMAQNKFNQAKGVKQW